MITLNDIICERVLEELDGVLAYVESLECMPEHIKRDARMSCRNLRAKTKYYSACESIIQGVTATRSKERDCE